MIRTRFAPSPTGYVHLGTLRTALFASLFARHEGGVCLLRVEDTDQERSVPGAVENLLRTLAWAGVVPDEGPYLDEQGSIKERGDFGPYTQSERLPMYKKYAEELVAKQAAYYCFCSSERLQALREEQQAKKLPTKYDRHCLALESKEILERIQKGESPVVRLKMPTTDETVFKDLVRGEVSFKNELIDDQVLLKSDGFPTYHLAVVVDDHLMQITHVIRGEDWISSTPKHIELYHAFGWQPPEFAHLPLLLNMDKSKLSKRQGDVAVIDYEAKGYLAQALVNFVAFLGWNPGGERELFTLEELVKEFSLEKVNKSGAVFNLEKLDWYNREYIKKLSPGQLFEAAIPWLLESGLIHKEGNAKYTHWLEKVVAIEAVAFDKICSLEKERITTLAELPGAIRFIFKLPDYSSEFLIWKKSDAAQAKKILAELIDMMNTIGVQDWNKASLETTIKNWVGEKGYSNGEVLWPLRVALSGQQNSPGPFDIADALGKEESLKRVTLAISKL